MRPLLCCSKMAEEPQQRNDDCHPRPSAGHQPGLEDVSEEQSQQSMPLQLSKEKLYEQRQKCELRRLLKHTHPELKMLDEVVDEELAEVLSSETGMTAGETGYEGEVLSRRLIFENSALSNRVSAYTSKIHTTEGKEGRGDICKGSAVFQEHKEKPCKETVSGIVEDNKMFASSQDSSKELEEENIRMNVQATRRMFESQSQTNTSRPNPGNKCKGVSVFGDETGAVQNQKKEFEMTGKDHLQSKYSTDTDVTEQSHKHVSCVRVTSQNPECEFSDKGAEKIFEDDPTNLLGPEGFEEMIKTSAALFKNNPFISTNVERENSYVHTSISQIPANASGAAEDYLITNVKDRAHLFESMPFDKIRQQNKDEIETMVENIRETLKSLYLANSIYSDGAIIEVNETMIAKKAKFTLSESGPKIKYDEVAEGGAQNLIFQLLPRANLKPQITYLKEDSKGSMEATVVNVPLHHHLFTTSQDAQFKTANMVQVVENILNQDNSLRKGVIIQEDATNCAEVMVYSLYSYFDEEDVKSYSPPQGNTAEHDEPETEINGMSKMENQGIRKGIIKSTISCFTETSQEKSCPGSTRPEVTVKGNVKLFRSCIEKGDLEYLKTLQAVPEVQEQEPSLNQTVGMEFLHGQRGNQADESAAEWVPVDIKRLKSLFSGDERQTRTIQNISKNPAPVSHQFTGQNVPLNESQSSKCNVVAPSHERVKHAVSQGNSTMTPSYLLLATKNEDLVHQAELVEVVDDNDIHNLQQSMVAVKSLLDSSQEKRLDQVSSEEPVVSVTAGNVKHSEAELPHENENQKGDSFTEQRWDELPSTSNFTSKCKSDKQHENSEICHEDISSVEVQTTETCSEKGRNKVEVVKAGGSETAPEQQQENEVVFQGKLQEALESLERSNMNVSRGDFRAAMIYRNSSKPYKDGSQNVASVQESTIGALCPVTEAKSTVPPTQDISKEQMTATNAELQSQSETLNNAAVPEKSKRSAGPRPVVPPKPEHLKVKQTENQHDNTKNPEATQTNTTKLTVPQVLPIKSLSYKAENMKDIFKINHSADCEGDAMSAFLESDNTDKNTSNQPEVKHATAKEKTPQDVPVKENIIETDDGHVDFHEACQKFRSKKECLGKKAPVKPKRLKIAQPDILAHMDLKPPQAGPSCNNSNTCGQTAGSNHKEMKQESTVEMREKKGRHETEDERRQRLSVHMDEIMRGNITAAMEIYDNLRKQEELQSILSRVEEIEKDTSEVDVRSLRKVYENIPDWVVSSDKRKKKKVKVEHKEKKLTLLKDSTESKSSMAHVFGDLEKASEEIINLKEQTLARLIDIEEAIKKALYSVSTLKSDSDIAGLSCLFKESLGTVEESPLSSNISKISIGSSRTKSPQAQESITSKGNAALPVGNSTATEVVSAKQRETPPSSPAFISIQSAARKTDKTEVIAETAICQTCQHNPNTEKNFLTTKKLTCNSPAQIRAKDPRKGAQKQSTYSPFSPKQELSVLEVQTDCEGNSIIDTKTVIENYERTDEVGNQFYSTKTSTVVSTQPETLASSTGEAVVSPATHQITTYPEVRLPINQKP